MTDCKTCLIPKATAKGGATTHGRPPRDLVDTVIPIEQFGGLNTATICVPTYNKLLTTELYRAIQYSTQPYPLEQLPDLLSNIALTAIQRDPAPYNYPDVVTDMAVTEIVREVLVKYKEYARQPELIQATMLLTSIVRHATVRYLRTEMAPENLQAAINLTSIIREITVQYIIYNEYPPADISTSITLTSLVKGLS